MLCLVAADVLVDVYLHSILEEYRVHLDNVSFTSFSHLVKAARRTNESAQKTVMYDPTVKPSLKM